MQFWFAQIPESDFLILIFSTSFMHQARPMIVKQLQNRKDFSNTKSIKTYHNKQTPSNISLCPKPYLLKIILAKTNQKLRLDKLTWLILLFKHNYVQKFTFKTHHTDLSCYLPLQCNQHSSELSWITGLKISQTTTLGSDSYKLRFM